MSYNIPYSFIPGTKARAQEVNANFKYVLDSADELNRTKLNTTFSNISTEAVDFIKNCSSSRNIGEIITSPLPLTDDGVHLLDGTLLFYGVYKEFIDYIADLYEKDPTANYWATESDWQASITQYGVCGKFVYDSVNKTVRLPKVTGIIEGTADLTVLGNLIEAGLPSINHTHNYTCHQNLNGGYTAQYASGCFSEMTRTSSVNSAVNPIYGKSNTVQPQTIKVLYYIVVATTSKTEIQSDLDEITTDLNGKADTDLTNITDTGYIKMAGAGMPSNTYTDLTLGASGSTYTAPADGWIYAWSSTASGAGGQYIAIYTGSIGNGRGAEIYFFSGFALQHPVQLPVKKNEVYTIVYNMGIDMCRFYYAVGSESEAQ